MKPSAARVLARLRQGPATTHDLMQADVGGVRFGARIGELREMGFSISERRLRPGSSEYRLDVEQASSEANGGSIREQADPPPVLPSSSAPGSVRSATPAEHLFGADEYRRGHWDEAA